MFVGLVALVGLLVGPILGIVVDRAVERECPQPLHRCQHCKSSLGGRSLVPVLNWFLKCPKTGSHRNWRYLLVDAATCVSFGLAAWRFGSSWMLLPYLTLFAVLIAMSVIDIETHLLVNILTYPSFLVGLFTVLTLSGPQGYEKAIWPAILGSMIFGGAILGAYLAYPPGMGLGDAKLAPTLGLFLGWLTTSPASAARLALYALIIGLLGAGLVGLALRSLRVLGGKAEIPMGPGLVAGTMLVVVFSERVIAL